MKKKSFLISLIVIMTLLLVSCNANADPASRPTPQGQASQTDIAYNSTGAQNNPIEEEDTSLTNIESSWQASSHANSFVLNTIGNNNSCAQCHAPTNWIPSMDDIPDSCLSCKFEIEDPDPLVPEQDWGHIPCKTCHKLDKKDIVEPGISWLAIAQIDEYEDVESPTELCQKCHLTKSGLAEHPGRQVAGTHLDYACTDCHDAHSTAASCGAADCHEISEEVTASIAGHDDAHQKISCGACHDAGELDVGPNAEETWVTYYAPLEDGQSFLFPSHNIELAVDCERCHYPDNPWSLSDHISLP